MSTQQQKRIEALWHAATTTERRALQEHVAEALPPCLGGLLARYGISAPLGQPAGCPPVLVMPAPRATFVMAQRPH